MCPDEIFISLKCTGWMCFMQTSTLCREMHTACPVHCPLSTTTSGTLSVRPRGVRTICRGVQQALATMRLKNGASVQCKVKKNTQTCVIMGIPPMMHKVTFFNQMILEVNSSAKCLIVIPNELAFCQLHWYFYKHTFQLCAVLSYGHTFHNIFYYHFFF